MPKKHKPKRLYQVWKGNNRFFCSGRLIFGPDVASLLISTLLIVVPTIMFCYQITAKIHNHDKLHDEDLYFLFMTSSQDPGIVLRNARPPEVDEASDILTPSMEWINGQTPCMRVLRAKDVIVNGFAIKVKYCDTCMLYRPPRASHCSICNNCVQKFDHHCPWVGQCIGLRSYRYFILFISTSTFLCIYIFLFSTLNIVGEKNNYPGSIWNVMKREVLSLVLMIYTFVTVWFIGGLTIFHLYLIGTNQTTYENFRYRYNRKENPYSKGILRSFTDLFFSKTPPSMVNFRSRIPEDAPETRSYSPNENDSKEASNERIPGILQNLEYSSTKDNNNDSDDEETREVDHVSIEVGEAINRSASMDADRMTAYESALEESYSSSTLIISDHNLHISRT
ncbi:probable protein S-acyltransferase 4 isoform X2 [Ananas comosus]|uniref:S-acyltransferase n=1 Tax=Ananas comosus TaxID=4615 RepID=A0A6P5FZ57_ANACO|nr:probable protein S-acyltransferase 4 isoform X2 [Ananas comosus]